MLLTSVFLVSLSTLAFEVLLTRVFSIGQWNHLSFMVISIALFGFAASGTLLSLTNGRKKAQTELTPSQTSPSIIICLYSISAILSFLALNHMPLDYFRLPVETEQSLYLLAAFALLALPFFFSGLIISTAYMKAPEKTGLIYFSTMSGSACGAILPVPLLSLLGEGQLIIASSVIPLVPQVFLILKAPKINCYPNSSLRCKKIAASCLTLVAFLTASFLLYFTDVSALQVKPSPYKGISQILQFPKSYIIETTNSIRGRNDRLETPYVRFAPGLSLKYLDNLPRQHPVFTDGDNQIVLYDITDKSNVGFAKYMLSYSGYHLNRRPQNALLIGHGGGSAIPCAVASGVPQITIIEQNPYIAKILRQHYHLNVINQNPRAFLAQSENQYDIIHIENWGASIPGAAALNQDHLLTIDAFEEYLKHLTLEGVIVISRKLLLPPSDSLRIWATAFEALKRSGVKNPDMHLAMLRNWDTFTLLISKPVVNTRVVVDFANDLNFDVVFLRNNSKDAVNKHNVFDEPYHFQKVNQLAVAYNSGKENIFFRTYLLDVAPQSDRRPFPGRYLKWPKLKLLYQSLGSRLYTLLMSGEIVIGIVFIEAVFLTVFILIIPLLVLTRSAKKPTFSQIFYFFCVGAGFMFVELYFIKSFILLLGDPVISFTLVIAGMLIFTSFGGLWMHKKVRIKLNSALPVLIIALVFTVAANELLAAEILKVSPILRYVIALLFLLPAGFLMGLPFPVGMRYIADGSVQRAYAWSVNGCASVLSAIIAAQIAVSFGIPVIIACAIGAYFLAWLSLSRIQ